MEAEKKESAWDLCHAYQNLTAELEELRKKVDEVRSAMCVIRPKVRALLNTHGAIQHDNVVFLVENDEIVVVRPKDSISI